MMESVGFVIWTVASFLAGAFCCFMVMDIIDEVKGGRHDR